MPDGIREEHISYRSGGASVPAFAAWPARGGKHPAILIAHEIYGLTPHMEDVARRFASLGYVALVPNLYFEDEVRGALSIEDIGDALRVFRAADSEQELAKVAAERKESVRRAVAWRAVASARASYYLPLLRDAIADLRARTDADEAVAAIGFSMGGGLVGRLSSGNTPLRAAVVYYGSVPPAEEVERIKIPILGHYGGADAAITSKVPEFSAAMEARGGAFTAYIYENAQHAFFNETRAAYASDAAKLSWQRTQDFLKEHVRR